MKLTTIDLGALSARQTTPHHACTAPLLEDSARPIAIIIITSLNFISGLPRCLLRYNWVVLGAYPGGAQPETTNKRDFSIIIIRALSFVFSPPHLTPCAVHPADTNSYCGPTNTFSALLGVETNGLQ